MTGGGLAGKGLGEFGRISAYFAPLAAREPGALGLVDDAALIAGPPGIELVLTADAQVEGVHFLGTDAPHDVARKLLRTNLSDLAAMGAVPRGYLLTIALPRRCDDDWVAGFAAGLAQDQDIFDLGLLGGDSVSTPGPITLSITALGHVPLGTAIRRSGALAGDLIFVSGTIGDGALGLLAATGCLSDCAPADQAFLADRYRLPQPRTRLGPALRGLAHAMMDVSDGLVADLDHLCAASRVRAELWVDHVPVSPATGRVLAARPAMIETVLTGGDDYELLFTVAPDRATSVQAAAAAAGVAVTQIGCLTRGDRDRPALSVLETPGGTPVPLSRRGWTHDGAHGIY